MESNLRRRLVNEELSAVQFIHDYLELHFQYKGFTLYVWPTVEINDKAYRYAETDYRNMLCQLIGQKVSQVKLIEDIILTIEFENGKIIEDLNPNNPDIISEICIFHDDGNIWVW